MCQFLKYKDRNLLFPIFLGVKGCEAPDMKHHFP